MPARDLSSSFEGGERRPSRDPTPPSREPTVKRGRGLSGNGVFGLNRQRSLHSSARAPVPAEPPPAVAIGLEKALNRSPSSSNAHSRQTSVATDRSLSRTQSNASTLASSTSPSPSRYRIGQDSFSSSDASTPRARPFLPNGISNTTNGYKVSDKNYAPERNTSQPQYQGQYGGTRRLARTDSIKAATERPSPLNVHLQRTANSQIASDVDAGGGFAMEELLSSFMRDADHLIEIGCATSSLHLGDPNLEAQFGKGVHPEFDRLLSSMGHITRRKPTPLIDGLIAWKLGHDKQRDVPTSLISSPSFDGYYNIAQNSGPQQAHGSILSSTRTNRHMPMYSVTEDFAERRSCAATFILCRALIDILLQTDLNSLGKQTAGRLEQLIFSGNLSSEAIDPGKLQKSSMHFAKWNINIEVLGVLSQLRFEGINMRFNQELKYYQDQLSLKGSIDPVQEARACQVLKAMGQLRPTAVPADRWISFCNCMLSIAEFFGQIHGQPCKNACCRTIEKLLLRLSRDVGVDVHDQVDDNKWKKSIHALNERLSPLVSKPKYWSLAYPAQVALACLSPPDLFAARWNQMMSSLPTRMRERPSRSIYLKAVCRLTWCNLRRGYDKDISSTARSLEDIARNVFFTGRKISLSKEPSITEPLIQLVRIIGYTYPDQCFKTIIFPLINSDVLSSPKETTIENLEPDKMIIGIRSFLAMISDLEENHSPQFPIEFLDERDRVVEDLLSSPQPDTSVPKTRSRKQSVVRDGRLSQPITTAGFSDGMKDHYNRFCDILGKITRVCDAAFGGQAILDEKLSLLAPRGPATDAWYPSFARRDDIIHSGDQRHDFYDLLHVAVQAIPRCITQYTPINELLNLLCTGTSHPEEDIAMSSAASLKCLARQGFAQEVASRFSSFIMNYDYRYSTMSDGGRLGLQHIENTLNLYLELLELWTIELHNKARGTTTGHSADLISTQPRQLDTSFSLNSVNDVESRGLFFLCSPSHRVRNFGVRVLRLVTKLDAALGETSDWRIYKIITRDQPQVLESVSHMLNVREKVMFRKSMTRGDQNHLFIDLCRSSDPDDNSLWHTIFPALVVLINQHCPSAVSLTRNDVCLRLSQMLSDSDESNDDRSRGLATSFDGPTNRNNWRPAPPAIESNVDQWKLYLTFTLTTITTTRETTPKTGSNDPNHLRSLSKSSQSSQKSINTADDLFDSAIPLLGSDNLNVRQATAIGLGSTNSSIYELLLQALDFVVIDNEEDTRQHAVTHSRGTSSPQGSFVMHPSRFQPETILVYDLTSRNLVDSNCDVSEWMLNHLAELTVALSRHLQQFDSRVDSLELRRRYCSLMERFYEGSRKTSNPSRWMSFQERKAHFILLEEWYDACSPRDNHAVQSPQEGSDATFVKPAATATETERLRNVASSAMASLCAGPLSVTINSSPSQFNVTRMLAWIENLLRSLSDKSQNTGRRALKNLIVNNKPYLHLTEHVIEKLFISGKSRMADSYLSVLYDIFMEREIPAVPHWKLLGALLFTLGHGKSDIRTKSFRLLQHLEELSDNNTKLQDYSIRVADKTRAVYKEAQSDVAEYLLGQHARSAFQLFSDYSKHFLELDQDAQRNMVTVLLPWMKSMELQLDPQGRPTGSSYMVLLNLLQMTNNSASVLPTEFQALWQSLTTGRHPSNVRLILDFVVQLCLDRKDQGSVEMVKQIIVFLSATEAGKGVADYLMQFTGPGSMVATPIKPIKQLQGSSAFTHVAGIRDIFPHVSEQMNLSIGHLSLILLVDLVVSDVKVSVERLPALLHMVTTLWDHQNTFIQEQSREMLIHLVHVFVLAKIDKNSFRDRQPSVEGLVDQIRRKDLKVAWSFSDGSDQDDDSEIPDSMQYVVAEALSLFTMTLPDVDKAWGRLATTWAMECRVRHLACRSLQIYRCIMKPLDVGILAGLIDKLAITISETPRHDLRTYAIDVMRTIKAIADTGRMDSSELLPHVFWCVYGSLESIHEKEYQEALSILDILLNKYDLCNASHVEALLLFKPPNWPESLDGLANYLFRGCSSRVTFEPCLRILNQILQVPPNALVGSDIRIPMTLIANTLRFMHSYDDATSRPACIETALTLINVGNSYHRSDWSGLFQGFAQGTLRSKDEFFDRAIVLVRSLMPPPMELPILRLLMSLLLNPLQWIKKETLRILYSLASFMDVNDPATKDQGSALIWPLFSLLQTEISSEALQVLDCLEPLAISTFDGEETSKELRRRSDQAKSLYGRPKPSGWSVPNRAQYRASSKQKLVDVYNNMLPFCEISETMRPQFYSFRDAAPSNLSDWSSSTKSMSIGSLDDIEDLDDFFGGADDSTGNNSISSGLTRSPPVYGNLGDAQIQTFIRQARKMSNASGSITPGSAQVMSPSALNPFPKRTLSRPKLTSRSITSPAVNQTTPTDRSLVVPKPIQEPLSDDDVSSGGTHERRNPYDTIRPAQPKPRPAFGLRNSIKRLAGEKHRRATTKMEVSPEVPRVPTHFLNNDPQSSDL